MPKHFSNEPNGRHLPGVPDASDVPDPSRIPGSPHSSAARGIGVPEGTRAEGDTTLAADETRLIDDETTSLPPRSRRGQLEGRPGPSNGDETIALTPEETRRAADVVPGHAAKAAPRNAPRKDEASEPKAAAPGEVEPDETMADDADDASGNLFEPLGKHDVAAVEPESHSYKAKPSPYLSKRQAARDPEKTKKRHSVMIGIALAAAAVAGVGGGAYYIHQQMQSQTQQTTTQYETARITRGEFLDTIDGSTTLEPIDTSDVMTQVTGTVHDLAVEDGTTVTKGQTLFTLDNPAITAATETAKDQRDQAQSDVDSKTQQVQDAQTRLDELRQTIQDGLASIYSIVGSTPGATSFNVDTDGDGTPDSLDTNGDGRADAFDTNGDGIVDMVDANGDGTPDAVDANGDGRADTSSDLPSNLTDQQRSDLASTETSVLSARSQLSSYQTAVDTGNSALQAAQDNLDSLQQAYDRALDQEKKLTVTAPIAGTVHDLSSTVTEGATLDTVGKVCTVDDMSTLTLTIQASEQKVRRAKVGQEARLTFPAIGDLNLTTSVGSVASKKTDGTDSYAISMSIDDPDSRLDVGTAVDVSIVLQQIEDVLTVPASAIHTQGQDSYVDVLLDPIRGIETMVQVNVVTSNEDNAVIEGDSIQEGNAVVLSKSDGDDDNGDGE